MAKRKPYRPKVNPQGQVKEQLSVPQQALLGKYKPLTEPLEKALQAAKKAADDPLAYRINHRLEQFKMKFWAEWTDLEDTR